MNHLIALLVLSLCQPPFSALLCSLCVNAFMGEEGREILSFYIDFQPIILYF